WDNWRLRAWNAPRLLALFREWGFHRLADEVRQKSAVRNVAPLAAVAAIAGPAPGTIYQGDLFGVGDEPPANGADHGLHTAGNWAATYHLVNTREEFDAFL